MMVIVCGQEMDLCGKETIFLHFWLKVAVVDEWMGPPDDDDKAEGTVVVGLLTILNSISLLGLSLANESFSDWLSKMGIGSVAKCSDGIRGRVVGWFRSGTWGSKQTQSSPDDDSVIWIWRWFGCESFTVVSSPSSPPLLPVCQAKPTNVLERFPATIQHHYLAVRGCRRLPMLVVVGALLRNTKTRQSPRRV